MKTENQILITLFLFIALLNGMAIYVVYSTLSEFCRLVDENIQSCISEAFVRAF